MRSGGVHKSKVPQQEGHSQKGRQEAKGETCDQPRQEGTPAVDGTRQSPRQTLDSRNTLQQSTQPPTTHEA